MGFMKEFKEFALKGSVVDMAIGVIIGAAFKDIVTSFTDNFITPLIASIGGTDIAGSIRLPWVDYTGLTLEEIQSLSLNYGAFISAIINFLIMAIILFVMLKGINALKSGVGKIGKKGKKEEPAPAPEPSDEVKLLTEIKDLLKAQKK
ncbi:large conductance mechanosensitive channel protein MscL [Butyrivibrio sp. AE2032]|uniref:large conductance mechanosensitive channel protein MscL n=1 Tax=Butyrivibrio sp. AE2032 TaxID=1458463 RepID=UPI000555040F|nr:large conductance mechanosensitive channel protein MscL [Butyrivibrio sp. AE2032]